MKRVVYGGTLTVVASVLVWMYVHQSTAAASTGPRPGKSAVQSEERADDESPQERPGPAHATRPTKRAPTPSAASSARRDPAPTADVPKLLHREVPAYLDTKFQAEPVDPGWARDTTATVRGTVQSSLPADGSLLSAECRSSMCRFEVQVASARAGESLIEDLLILPKARLGLGSAIIPRRTVGPGGETQVLIFVARQGGELPPMDVMPDDPTAFGDEGR